MLNLSRSDRLQDRIKRINDLLKSQGRIVRYDENSLYAVARIDQTSYFFLCQYDEIEQTFYPTHALPLTRYTAHKRYFRNVRRTLGKVN